MPNKQNESLKFYVTREMTWQLKALVALVEDLGMVPSTHIAAHNSMLTPMPWDLILSSSLHRDQEHACQYIKTCRQATDTPK